MDAMFTSPQQPSRRSTALSFPLNSTPTSSSFPSSNPSTSSDAVDVPSLRKAAQLLDRELAFDEKRQDSFDQLDTRDSGHYRYEKSQLTVTRHITLPQPLIDQYDTVECQSYAGLLPLIHRAYVTIDNRLYLFNYDDPTDYYAYTDLQQLIISVAIVRPKPGIFTDTIPYLLLLTTPVEVHLLAVSFASTVTSPLTLYPTAFSISSDNVSFIDVTSTTTGRIFLAGKDGHLYELDYQPRDGWFRRKMRKVRVSVGSSLPFPVPTFLWPTSQDPINKVVVDESRNPPLLFTLQASSTITVYALSAGEGGVKQLSCHRTVWEQSKELLYNLHPNSTEDWVSRADFSLTSIHPIPRTESERVVLVAVTSHGHRLYFTLYESYYTTLAVKFIRLSPPSLVEPDVRGLPRALSAFEPAWRKGRSPESVHFAYVKNGVVLMAESIPNAGDHLLCLNRDFTPSSPKLIEAVDPHTLPSKIADLAEADSTPYSTSVLSSCVYARGQQRPLVGLSEFASQHLVGPRVFVALTPVSVVVFSRRRAIDGLCDVLMRRRRTLDDEELTVFFHQYGWKESGAMLLTLACSLPSALALTDGRGVEEMKEREVYILSPGKYDHHPIPDDALIKQAKQTFFRFAASASGSPPPSTPLPPALHSSSQGGLSYSLTPFVPSVVLSPSLSSLVLFISRVIRPVWDWPITVTTPTTPPTLTLRYTPSQLAEMRGWVQRVFDFMDEYRRLLARVKDDVPVVDQLHSLLRISLELMAFLHLLALHSGVTQLLGGMNAADAAVLGQSKFYDLITSPSSYLLLKQLMLSSSSHPSSSSTEWVQNLHQLAPTFFDHSDFLLYRAAQALQRLQSLYDDRDRAPIRDEALGLYRMAARGPSFPIRDVGAALRQAGVWEGAVELALYRAELLARGDVSRGGDDEDWALNERQACYQVAVETLTALLFPQTPLTDGGRVVDLVLSMCLSSQDTEFLSHLYPLLIKRDMKAVLFSHPSPHLPAFLGQHEAYALLLRDYFLVQRQHREASILLHQLSMTRSTDYSLNDRLGFLSRALACAKEAIDEGAGITGTMEGDSEYCEAIKDRIEVAKLQQKLQAKLISLPPSTPPDTSIPDSIRRLDEELMDVEGLYLMAHTFSLWDVCLAIFYFSNERQREDVIAALWRNVLRSEIAHQRAVAPGVGWEGALGEKMAEMVGLYGGVGFMFPLDLIVNECEFNEWRFGTQRGGVAEMLCKAGVEAGMLARAYERLVEEVGGMEEGMELQVYESVAWLLEMIVGQGGGKGGRGWGGNVELYGLSTRCQEALTSLQPTKQTEALTRRLASVQQKISRMNG